MQFTVNGKVFDSIDEAKGYMESLEQEEINKMDKIKSLVLNNTHLMKFTLENGNTLYMGVIVADEDKDILPSLCVATLEKELGVHFTLYVNPRTHKYNLTEKYRKEDITTEEIDMLSKIICKKFDDCIGSNYVSKLLTDAGDSFLVYNYLPCNASNSNNEDFIMHDLIMNLFGIDN